jgi:hypothetical protein
MKFLSVDGCYYVFESDSGLTSIPRISAILSATESDRSKQRMAAWREANPGVGERAAERGTNCHAYVADYLLHESSGIHDPEAWEFFSAVLPVVEKIENPVWVEQAVGKDDNDPIWSETLGCAGRPDIIGTLLGELSLIDLKTCKGLYYRSKPRISNRQLLSDKEHPETIRYFCQWRGWLKWEKVKLQLVAYKEILREFKIYPQRLRCLVSNPHLSEEELRIKPHHQGYQLFTLTLLEEKNALREWHRRLSEAHQQGVAPRVELHGDPVVAS